MVVMVLISTQQELCIDVYYMSFHEELSQGWLWEGDEEVDDYEVDDDELMFVGLFGVVE